MQSDNCHSADHSYPDLGLYSPYFQSVQKSAMFLLFLNIVNERIYFFLRAPIIVFFLYIAEIFLGYRARFHREGTSRGSTGHRGLDGSQQQIL